MMELPDAKYFNALPEPLPANNSAYERFRTMRMRRAAYENSIKEFESMRPKLVAVLRATLGMYSSEGWSPTKNHYVSYLMDSDYKLCKYAVEMGLMVRGTYAETFKATRAGFELAMGKQ